MQSTLKPGGFAVLLSAGIMLAGCTQWVRPGATVYQRDAALSRCEAGAYRRAPERDVTVRTSSGGWKEGDKHCEKINGQRNCYRDDAYYQPATYGTKDINASARDSLVSQCMNANGWHLE